MAFQLTLPTLLGIIIGGVAFFFCLAVAVVVQCLRIKHRRQLARTNATGERRLSRFPGRHLRITDEDIAQLPGTGAAMRNSLCNRYTRASAYAPMESRESIEKQSSKNTIVSIPISDPLTLPNRAVVTDLTPVSNSPTRSWPLPRRLTRVNRPPAIDLQLPLSSNAIDTSHPLETVRVKQKSAEKPTCVPRDEIASARSPHLSYESQNILGACPGKLASASPTLRPKPLFHEKQRSISYGMIPEINGKKRSGSAQGGQESHNSPANVSASPLPRSKSLTNQGPGTIPIGPVPPLPAEAQVIRRQRSRKASGSRQSLVAATLRQNFGGTSDIDRSPIKEISQTPVKVPTNSANQLMKGLCVADGKIPQPPASPAVTRIGTLKAPLDSRESFQTNIQDNITRSNSSGLSESLLNHGWSRSVSNASMIKEISHARTRTPTVSSIGAHISVFDFGLPLRADIDIGALSQLNSDDLQVKHRSASILQAISGNEQNPGLDLEEERPISIATEIPHRWSPDILAKETGDDGEPANGSVQARHRYKRLSKYPYTPTSRSSRISGNVQKSKLSRTPPQSEVQTLRRPRVDPPAFRPPSKLTFDPQLTGTPRNKPHPRNTPSPIPYFKSTLAILTAHDDSDSSSSSPPPTPTRKPSQKRQPSGTHPNRQRAIFDGPSKIAQWPIVGQHAAISRGRPASNDESPEKANNVFRLDEQLNASKNMVNKAASREDEGSIGATSHRPPSLLYCFPSPPSPSLRKVSDSGCGGALKFPSKFQSSSQPIIQNSRLDRPISPSYYGAHSKTTSNLNARTVDSRRPGEGVTRSPSDQLRQSVLALRPMNSEVSESSKAGREHRRYLNLGQKEEAIFEDGDDDGDVSSGVRRMESRSSVTTVLGAHTPLPPSSNRKEDETEREKEKGKRAVVRGPRAMPGWLDEGMMSSSTSYAPNVAEAEHNSRNWFEGEEFSKLF